MRMLSIFENIQHTKEVITPDIGKVINILIFPFRGYR
jgi:hypothetical protein